MEVALTPKPRQAAKREIVRQFEHGVSVEDVRGRSPAQMHRTTIYRLLKRVQHEGEGAFNDGRHGHPVKIRGEIRAFLLEHCQNHPSVSSSAVQRLLAERFGHEAQCQPTQPGPSYPWAEPKVIYSMIALAHILVCCSQILMFQGFEDWW